MIALILGGAPSVFDDAQAAKALVGERPYIVVAANLAGIHYAGRLAAWASLHPDRLNGWFAERAERGGNSDYRVFVPNVGGGAYREEVLRERWPGSSGLFATQAALGSMGASGAILCGIPMDQSAGHFVHPGPWARTASYRLAFQAAAREIGPRVRSMGGWTQELFGAPTADWLDVSAIAGPSTDPKLRMIPMFHVENASGKPQGFNMRLPDGNLVRKTLRHGEAGAFDCDANQAVFVRGHLTATKIEAPAAPEPKAPALQPGEVLHKPVSGPARALKAAEPAPATPAPPADNDPETPEPPAAA